MTQLDEIRSRFENNLGRVRTLIEIYDRVTDGGRRRAAPSSDVLRAGVVFLHAALEDLLRSLAEWKLPDAGQEILAKLALPLPGHREAKFGLGDLAAFRGQSVDDVIGRSVRDSLERSSYNHPGDIKNLLQSIGLSMRIVDPLASDLAALMNRRHWIVHRVDRDYSRGPGSRRAQSIRKSTVVT